MAVTEETEAKVRADREAAIEYADRVLAGEKPWEDDNPEGEPDPNGAANDDVGETGEPGGPEFIEVNEAEIDKPTE